MKIIDSSLPPMTQIWITLSDFRLHLKKEQKGLGLKHGLGLRAFKIKLPEIVFFLSASNKLFKMICNSNNISLIKSKNMLIKARNFLLLFMS
jgi:hypothetical protein